jgi:hypothetical protein
VISSNLTVLLGSSTFSFLFLREVGVLVVGGWINVPRVRFSERANDILLCENLRSVKINNAREGKTEDM